MSLIVNDLAATIRATKRELKAKLPEVKKVFAEVEEHMRRIVQMWTKLFYDLFEIGDFTHTLSIKPHGCYLMSVINSRAFEDFGSRVWQRRIRQSADYSFATWAVVLPNVSISHRVIKTKFVDYGL
jgi:hypothetical protein